MTDNDTSIQLLPIVGLRLGVANAAIKQSQRPDLLVMELAAGTRCAAVFTQNAFCAAPVIVAREHIAATAPRYLLINSGNANAGTGAQGLADARACCQAVAEHAGGRASEVLPFSTGVIGEHLPLERFTAAIPAACAQLHAAAWDSAARAIMTTDTVPKGVSRQCEINGRTVTVTGIAKGAGMIRPDMATMLAYIATDAGLEQDLLQKCLSRAVQTSFNRISVDGDTSTNDACVLMATGQSGVSIRDEDDMAWTELCQTVQSVCEELAQAIVRDGEGASKLITVVVEEGASEAECLQVAYTIAHSPLVKTAFFASDPNWGRILAAVGRAGLTELDIQAIRIYLDKLCIVENGGRASAYSEAAGQEVMAGTEITVRVCLGRGSARSRIWTCDLSYDYVRINAEYRT